jgi:olfactory receptor
LADISFFSTTIPKMIVSIQTHSREPSPMRSACLRWIFTYVLDTWMTCLTVMAYDWFASICHLLNCWVVMNLHLCVFLVLLSFWFLLEAQLHILGALHITNFKIIEIINFFDPSQVLSLSCTDTFINRTLKYIISTINGLLPISALLFFYYKIVPTILRIP